MRKTRILLDANVLVDAPVRDLFCRFAEAELIEVYWSPQILDEAARALRNKIGLSSSAVEVLHRCAMAAVRACHRAS